MATQADTTNSTASKRMRGASPDDLAVVAQRAQAFTNASGVAIALNEGNADEIVCRARSGSSAPDVGSALRVEGTFTGLCIQSGKELRCDDCETDTRVDMAAIRALGIRSMVVTPIREESRVIGVLAAFAPTPHAFTITHVAVLKTMADQISVLLQKERRAREENPQPEIPRHGVPAIVARPVIAPAPVTPPAVVIKSATPAFSKAEQIKSVPLEVVPLATPPKADRRADFAPRPSFGSYDSVAEEEKPSGSKFMVVGVVAVLIVAAAATFVFLKMQKPGSSAKHVQEAVNDVQPAQPSTPAPAGNSQSAATAAANVLASTAAPAVIVAANPVPSRSTTESDARKSGSKSASDKAFNTQDKPAPAEKQAVVATLAASGQSKISQRSQEPQAQEIAPSFSISTGNAPPTLTSLASPVASSTPAEAAIEKSQLEPLRLIKAAQLVYPAIAKAHNITGTVVVQFKVGKDGKVSNLQLISGPPIFRDAAFEAASKCQFKPAKLNGQPVDQITQMKFNF
jgi:TonB family protein